MQPDPNYLTLVHRSRHCAGTRPGISRWEHLRRKPTGTLRTETKNGLVFFSVADRGPGIDQTEVGRIFEKFYRGKEHRCRVQGTGMGLPIAKAIIAAQQGSMSVTSQLGHGSVFSFTLPIDRSQKEER